MYTQLALTSMARGSMARVVPARMSSTRRPTSRSPACPMRAPADLDPRPRSGGEGPCGLARHLGLGPLPHHAQGRGFVPRTRGRDFPHSDAGAGENPCRGPHGGAHRRGRHRMDGGGGQARAYGRIVRDARAARANSSSRNRSASSRLSRRGISRRSRRHARSRRRLAPAARSSSRRRRRRRAPASRWSVALPMRGFLQAYSIWCFGVPAKVSSICCART